MMETVKTVDPYPLLLLTLDLSRGLLNLRFVMNRFNGFFNIYIYLDSPKKNHYI